MDTLNSSTPPIGNRSLTSHASNMLGRYLAAAIHKRLKLITWGQLTLITPNNQTLSFGNPNAQQTNQATATILIHDYRSYSLIALEQDIGVGRAWAKGYWDSSDLYSVLRIFLANAQVLDTLSGQFAWLKSAGNALIHKARANSKKQARENISAHYDLGNDFFSAWLDSRMLYSSAVFLSDNTDLESAQLEKIDRICRKLRLKPGQKVLEIGSGWGGFALHAANKYQAQVLTTTLSQQQYDYVVSAVQSAGLTERITVLLDDYRDLTPNQAGQFDAVVSIEMIEAVGHEYYDQYASIINQCLKPNGQALIQAITTPESNFEGYSQRSDFIKHFIFPGGCLPSVEKLIHSFGHAAHMRLFHLEDFGPDYATTLLHWHQRFVKALPQLPSQYQDPWFSRLWSFYLLSCAALFEQRNCGLVQLYFVKPESRPAPVYMETVTQRSE